jgi:hypothetical protein
VGIFDGLASVIEGERDGHAVLAGLEFSARARLWQASIGKDLHVHGAQQFSVQSPSTYDRDLCLSAFQLEQQAGLLYRANAPSMVGRFHLVGEVCASPKPFTAEGVFAFLRVAITTVRLLWRPSP